MVTEGVGDGWWRRREVVIPMSVVLMDYDGGKISFEVGYGGGDG